MTLLVVVLAGCSFFRTTRGEEAASEHAAEHGRMMLRIEEAGVKDPLVLEAMRVVPRHKFVPEENKRMDSLTHAFPLEPVLFAQMLELLGLKGGERVLHLYTGSGYEAAVLSRIAGRVYSVEISPAYVDVAARRFERLAYSNVSTRCSDPAMGWEEHAPYDAIIETVLGKTSQALVSQLKEGGRMVVPVAAGSEAAIRLLVKQDGKVTVKDIAVRLSAPEKQKSQEGSRRMDEGK